MANDIPDELFKRMVLMNQYRMLALLEPDQKEMWERAAETARRAWPVEDLPDVDVLQSYMRDALTKEDQLFVLDSFEVFELIQDAVKRGLRPTRPDAHLQFPGFDGNNEPNLLSYARHVLAEGRFTQVTTWTPDLNSRMPSIELYQRMIAVWGRYGRPRTLNQEQLDALVDAQIHPSMRRPAT